MTEAANAEYGNVQGSKWAPELKEGLRGTALARNENEWSDELADRGRSARRGLRFR
jgi:hypothetical protein